MDILNPKLEERAQRVATRWGLEVETILVSQKNRLAYKVSTPRGPAIFKVYRDINAAGERSAAAFYKKLPLGIGPELYRASPLRRAILVEWLNGPNLMNLIEAGEEGEANAHLSEVIRQLRTAKLRIPFRRLRLADILSQKLKRIYSQSRDSASVDRLQRIGELLDWLVASTKTEQVIHGDLHYDNVILTSSGPKLFDPKVYLADPAAECCKVLFTGQAKMAPSQLWEQVSQRAECFASGAGGSPTRLMQWGAVNFATRVLRSRTAVPETHEALDKLDLLLRHVGAE